MRLTEQEQQAIRNTVRGFLPTARVYLFGSRTDETQRGGDIDLLILSNEPVDRSTVRQITLQLFDEIGEQKIDLLVEQEHSLSPFATMILPQAVPL